MGPLGDLLRRSLAPARPDPPARGGVPAAVLVPLVDDPDPTVVLTRRSQGVRTHKGEVSFPGGSRHDDDDGLLGTALRETYEEVGIPPEAVEVLGSLPPTRTFVSGFVIVPFVGLLAERPVFVPSPEEIDAVLELRVRELLATERLVERTGEGGRFQTWLYETGGATVWGATARILHALLRTLRRAGWA